MAYEKALSLITGGGGSGGGLNILPIVDGKVTCAESDVTAGTLFVFDRGDGQYSINAVMDKTYNDRTGSTEATTIGAGAGGSTATVWTYNTSEGAFIPNE